MLYEDRDASAACSTRWAELQIHRALLAEQRMREAFKDEQQVRLTTEQQLFAAFAGQTAALREVMALEGADRRESEARLRHFLEVEVPGLRARLCDAAAGREST